MHFRVTPQMTDAEPQLYPFIELRRMAWNDWWTYRTLFYATHVAPDGVRYAIGAVKIARIDYEYIRTDVGVNTPLQDEFTSLPSDYASVGQAESYYSNLRAFLGVEGLAVLTRIVVDVGETSGVKLELSRFP